MPTAPLGPRLAILSLAILAAAPRAAADGQGPAPAPRPAAVVAPSVATTPDPAASRKATAACCAPLLAKGGATSLAIEKILDEGSVGALPARVESRAALARSLAQALSGLTVEAAAAAAVSDVLAVAANSDGLASSEIVETRAALLGALAALRVPPERAEPVAADFDRVVCEARCPALKRVSSDLRAVEVHGEVTAAHAKWLEADLVALSRGKAKPSAPALRSLALDLSIALDESWLSAKAQARLVYALDAVLSVSAATAEAFEAVARDVKDLLQAAHVDRVEAALLVMDLQVIHGETTGPQPSSGIPPPKPR